jgi:hypothetical protein
MSKMPPQGSCSIPQILDLFFSHVANISLMRIFQMCKYADVGLPKNVKGVVKLIYSPSEPVFIGSRSYQATIICFTSPLKSARLPFILDRNELKPSLLLWVCLIKSSITGGISELAIRRDDVGSMP